MTESLSSDQTWEWILSRNPEAIRTAFTMLDKANRQAVLAHLHKMASDPGWHAEQVTSAQIALEALRELEL